VHALTSELLDTDVPLGDVDISFYRDDLTIRPSAPIVHATHLEFPIDDRTIVIVDDVLYTGRTVRAAIDEIFDYGRPARVQLAALVDRGHRELPIRPDYVGKNLPTSHDQRVNVRVQEVDGRDEVTIGPAAEPRRAAA
jgi:pyrimidine operon attenuation protein/uracil phosphoribosyltransferase